jgi:hemerythrin-like metal-binding protein
MTNLQWNDTFSVGFKLIDDQHKILISLINDLYVAKRFGTLKTAIIGVLEKLAAYTVYHFNAEKELFTQYKYPKTSEHLAEHDYFVDKVKGFQKVLITDGTKLSLKTIDFLKDWTITHILGWDKEFGEYVKQHDH